MYTYFPGGTFCVVAVATTHLQGGGMVKIIFNACKRIIQNIYLLHLYVTFSITSGIVKILSNAKAFLITVYFLKSGFAIPH